MDSTQQSLNTWAQRRLVITTAYQLQQTAAFVLDYFSLERNQQHDHCHSLHYYGSGQQCQAGRVTDVEFMYFNLELMN